MRRSLTRPERLASTRDIRAVFRSGDQYRGNGMKLFVMPNHGPINRVVVVPAKGFRTAVARNRCRRHGKEAYRALKNELETGFDLVVLCYTGDYSFAERQTELSRLLEKASLLQEH